MRTLPLILSLTILISCQPKQPESLSGIISINPDEFINPPKNATEWIESMEFIALETPKGQYVPGDAQIKIRGNYILMGNYDLLLIFDLTGKFISKIDAKGAGPQEYRYLVDYDLLPGQEEIVICEGRVMDIYRIDGTFVEKHPVPFLSMTVAALGADHFGFLPGRITGSRDSSAGNSQLFITDRDGQILEKKFNFPYQMINAGDRPFIRSADGKSNLFAMNFDDDIYQLGPDSRLRRVYQFDFGGYNSDTTYLQNPAVQTDDKYLQRNQVRTFPIQFGITTNTLVFWCSSEKHEKMATRLINLKSGHHRTVVMNERPLLGSFHGWPVYPFITSFRDYIVILQSAFDTKEHLGKLSEEQKDSLSGFPGFRSLQSLKEDDNPVVVLYKVKDF